MGARKAPLSLPTGVSSPPRIISRKRGLMRAPQAGLAWRSSYTLMPSLSQRGILFFVSVRVTVWQNSCHSTDSQLAGEGSWVAGLLAVMRQPKHTPRKPGLSGMPKVRTPKSFWSAKISTVTGRSSFSPYLPHKAWWARSSSRKARGPYTTASRGSMRTMKLALVRVVYFPSVPLSVTRL